MRTIELTIIDRASWASPRAPSSAASTRSQAVGACVAVLAAPVALKAIGALKAMSGREEDRFTAGASALVEILAKPHGLRGDWALFVTFVTAQAARRAQRG